jgi:hypothetical protein
MRILATEVLKDGALSTLARRGNVTASRHNRAVKLRVDDRTHKAS